MDQERKGTQTQTFCFRISLGGVGVFQVKGWGPKSSVCASKPRDTKLSWWDIPGFLPGYPGGARKVREKEFVFNFWPPMERLAMVIPCIPCHLTVWCICLSLQLGIVSLVVLGFIAYLSVAVLDRQCLLSYDRIFISFCV